MTGWPEREPAGAGAKREPACHRQQEREPTCPRSEREHARHRRIYARDSGPNELKLSDRHRRSQACQAEKSRPPVPVRWSALLGPRPRSAGRRNGGRGLRRGNDGRCRRERVSEAVDSPNGRTRWQSEREPARLRRNGNTLALEKPSGKDSGPNELKLSDRGWRGETQPRNRPQRQPLFAGARG